MKGFLIFAQNSEHNYVNQACLLAMSIHKTTPNSLVSIVTNDDVPEKYKQFFDKIIPIDTDLAKDSNWKIENRVAAYELTPYDETVVFDSDMLMLDSFDTKWQFLENYELYFCTSAKTFRNVSVTSRYYRAVFDANYLPDFYSAIYYFKKTEKTKQFFERLKWVMHNWHSLKLWKKQKWPSIDVSTAIASELENITEQITSNNDLVSFVHMKPNCQGWKNYNKSWMTIAPHFITDDFRLYVGGEQQYNMFHYTEKEFCDELKLEKYYDSLVSLLS
jgi:hypothetical protein